MDEVGEIKQRLDVAEVVGGYITLKQAGRNLKAPCPFHNEKSASFMVSPEKGIWHCFGCGEGGDIFKFVMRMEGLEFRPALELLAKRAGVELKESGKGNDSKLKERLTRAHEWAVKYFQASLVRNERALNYVVKKRGLTKQTVKDFQIGFAPESWEGLVGVLRKKGFNEDELLRAGLAGQRSSGRGVFDMFRGRIMFTICDAQGRPIGFTGRVLDDSQPKYLNTPQTLLYDKSRAIYGLHLAKEAIRKADEVVLVEGNMDVVASHQAGVKQVVAASGTALTLDQLKTLGRLTKNIKLAFDQDAAGLAATERSIELAQKLGLMLKVVEIKDAKDPDELIVKSVELWQQAIAAAPYVADYLFERFKREYDLTTATGKRMYSDRLAANLKRLADPVERDHYVQLLAKTIGVTTEAVKEKLEQSSSESFDIKSTAGPVNRPQVKPVQNVREPQTGKHLLEEEVLALSLAYPDSRLCLDDLVSTDFDTEVGGEILVAMQRDPNASPDSIAKLLPNLSDYVKILTLRGEEQYASLDPADRSSEAFTLARRLQIIANKKHREELSVQLREAETKGDVALALSLREKYQGLIEQG
jgi:DNA primase